MENARIVLEFICGLFLLDILLDILYLLYLLRALCFLKNLSLQYFHLIIGFGHFLSSTFTGALLPVLYIDALDQTVDSPKLFFLELFCFGISFDPLRPIVPSQILEFIQLFSDPSKPAKRGQVLLACKTLLVFSLISLLNTLINRGVLVHLINGVVSLAQSPLECRPLDFPKLFLPGLLPPNPLYLLAN